MSILYSSLALVAGLIALIFAADRFVGGASTLARGLGVQPAMVGLTIVDFGSAAPELLVAAIAALEGSPDLALGNALGSNITNLTGVLGVVAIASPLAIPREILRRDLALLLAFIGLASVLMIDGALGRIDGLILIACLFAYLYFSFAGSRGDKEKEASGTSIEPLDSDEPSEEREPTLKAALVTALSFAVLLGGAHLLVYGASSIARAAGISELIIGLTILALGTSLPELAASISAARSGEDGLAIGNLIGANIYNILAVLGVPAIIAGVEREAAFFGRDLPLVLGSIALFASLALLSIARGRRLGRAEGAILGAAYIGYLVFIGG